MATMNKSRSQSGLTTHEGAPASRQNAVEELRRTVLSCLLFEDTFYEGKETIADRLKDLVARVPVPVVEQVIIDARTKHHLRHVPLWLCRCLAANKTLKASVLEAAIQRADELTEFLALYWKDGRQKLSAPVKRGLAAAFKKFSAYQLAKYNRDKAVKLRDVLRLVHPKPTDAEQAEVWRKLVKGTLEAPDTWEVALSSGADKQETWERLLQEKKLGGLALLRNLRNMLQAGVDVKLIKAALNEHPFSNVLPFRFLAAARHAPELEHYIDLAMLRAAGELPPLNGKTVILIDVSGSMTYQLSSKSDLTRMDAACALAVLLREVCEDVQVFSFSTKTVAVPPRTGMALRDAIVNSQAHGGTLLGEAIRAVSPVAKDARLIVITDEQSQDQAFYPKTVWRGYAINVAPYQYGVTYGHWHHINGFSERIVDFIREVEQAE